MDFADDRLTGPQWTVRSAAFRTLLHEGRRVSVDDLMASTGLGRGTIEETVRWFEGGGFARHDSEARLVGIAGLTVTPTYHSIEGSFGVRWTWCALDAVGIVAAVGDGTIRSQAGRHPIELVIRDSFVADSEVVVFLPDGYGTTSVVDEWCPDVNFHPTRSAAESWQTRTGVAGNVVDIDELAAAAAPRWSAVINGELHRRARVGAQNEP